MDLIEFSIACKLISLKLRNVEVPKLLPPTLVASLKHIGTPIRTPTGAMSPTEGYKQFIPPVPNVPIQPVAPAPAPLMQQPPQQPLQQQYQQHQQQLQQQAMMMAQQQPMMVAPAQQTMGIQAIPQQQQISPEMLAQQQMMLMQQQQMLLQQQQQMQQPIMTQQIVQPMMSQPAMVPMSSAVPIIPTGTVLPSQPPMMATVLPNIAAPPSKPPLVDQLSNSSLLDSLAQVQPMAAVGSLPAAPTPTPPQSGHASRSMSFSEKAPSVPESPTWVLLHFQPSLGLEIID